jgi:hypothetical protein
MDKEQWLRNLSLKELEAFISAAESDYAEATTMRDEAIALSKARDGWAEMERRSSLEKAAGTKKERQD